MKGKAVIYNYKAIDIHFEGDSTSMYNKLS